ncbi:MAG: phosphotransferase [Candidatus Heimdallarchaeota archaeon]|nr:MAG: phosphotransferase [Candidatus Heimdallarchaeota archaeon]
MNPKVAQELSDKFCLKWDVDSSTLSFLRGFENQVYSFKKDGLNYILRVGHSNHMSHDLVQAEMDWIAFLHNHGIPVPKPLVSLDGKLVEKFVVENDYFNVIALEKIPGNHLDFQQPRAWSEEIIYQWGKIIGKMHALSKEYITKNNRRYDFNPTATLVEEMIPNEPNDIKSKIIEIFQSLKSLPKTKDSYGLVHSDLHPGNFLIRNKAITGILDFDRTCYKWFISEIAVALYYPLYHSPLNADKNQQEDFLLNFIPKFWEGYKSENFLDSQWLSTLNTFVKVRDAILFLYFPRSQAQALDHIKSRLMNEESYVNLQDFTSAFK